MRISFDLDDTLICYGGITPCEKRLPALMRIFIRDEPLRKGSRELIATLRQRGHEVWIYTSSNRPRLRIRFWLLLHGIRVTDIVNGLRHSKCFGQGSLPTKRPHAFGIALHIDDSVGVAIEGKQHGFQVCVIDPAAADWAQKILGTVESEAMAEN
jgi:hypothetical protein